MRLLNRLGLGKRGTAGSEPEGVRHALADLVSGAVVLPSVTVSGAFGPDCFLFLPEGATFGATLRIENIAGKPLADVVIALGAVAGGSMHFCVRGTGARFEMGASHFFNASIFLLEDCNVRIGGRTTSNNLRLLCRGGSVVIGEDGMIAGEVVIEAAQHHGLVDLSTPRPQIKPRRSDVRIGDHVWLGTQSLILDRAEIGSGSVLGAGAVASGRYGRNSVIVGNPAKVIRENTTWCREPDRIDYASAAYIRTAMNVSGATGSGQSNATPA